MNEDQNKEIDGTKLNSVRRHNTTNYQRMYENSVNGEPIRRTREKRKVKHKTTHKKLKTLLAGAVIGACLTIEISNLTETMHDNAIINGLASEFFDDVVLPATHRTADNKNYFYDYMVMAQKIQEMDNFDEGVYYLIRQIGEEQTDLVLEHTDYKNFTNYKKVRGYEDTKEFKKNARKMILLEDNIESNKEELDRMLDTAESENNNVNMYDSGIGGK